MRRLLSRDITPAETSTYLSSGPFRGPENPFLQTSNACKNLARTIAPKLTRVDVYSQLEKIQITTLFDDPLGWLHHGYKQGLQVPMRTSLKLHYHHSDPWASKRICMCFGTLSLRVRLQFRTCSSELFEHAALPNTIPVFDLGRLDAQ